MTRSRLATVWLDGCSGCHMSFLDMDERLLDLATRADLVYSPLVDTKEFPADVDITLVEGAVSTEDDLDRIRVVRQRTTTLVSLGDCAVTSNVPGMRNPIGAAPLLERAYVENVSLGSGIPVGVPRLFPTSRPVHAVVHVDVFLPGCPPSADLIHFVLTELLDGRMPDTTSLTRFRKLRSSMPEIVIDPVTRIEGHSKITLHLDDDGSVTDARFHVTQFRGFERICDGRPLQEMPSLMARICGICPVSHLMASAKACDEILAVEPPEVALKLRRVMNLAQIVQSHALSFFHLSSPDLVFGFDGPSERRHLFGVAEANPQLARDGIGLRRFGQQIIERLGGRRIHPAWVVAGGVSRPLEPQQRDDILRAIDDAHAAARRTLDWYKERLADWADEAAVYGDFPSLYMGLVHNNGDAAYSDGLLRVVDGDGNRLADDIEPRPYWEYVGEAVEPWSYLKSTFWKDLGYPDGMYRVGPLARLNVVDQMGTDEADAELVEYRERLGRHPSSSFHYHYARLIEVIHCIAMIRRLLESPEILDRRVRAEAGVNRGEGVGVAEAPRGTLMHHYRVDDNGIVTWVNLVIATGHNNLAMNRGVLEVARHYVDGEHLEPGVLNRVESVIRCFDPCLSCSTHAIGSMPLRVQLLAADGTVLDELTR